MNVYVIKKATGEILSVNRTLAGCAMELFGLDIARIGEADASEDNLTAALDKAPSVECRTSDDEKILVERHYLSN